MKKVLLILMVMAACVNAQTDKYVSVAGSGAQDGSTAGNSWTMALAITNAAAGQRINVLAGAYSGTSSTWTYANAGTAIAPIIWRGYNTTVGDLDVDSNNTLAKPIITFTTGAISFTGAYQLFENIAVIGATTSKLISCNAGSQYLVNDSLVNTGANANSWCISNCAHIDNCYCNSNAAATYVIDAPGFLGRTRVVGGINGIRLDGSGIAYKVIISGPSAQGILYNGSATNQGYVIASDIHKCGSDGIGAATAQTAGNLEVVKCIIDSCVGYPINQSSGANSFGVHVVGCDLWANGNSNAFNGITYLATSSDAFWNQGAIRTETAVPFVNAPVDFSIKTGTKARQLANPFYFKGTNDHDYPDIGALQKRDTTCTGGACPACSLHTRLDTLINMVNEKQRDSVNVNLTTGLRVWFHPNGDSACWDTVKQSGSASTDSITISKTVWNWPKINIAAAPCWPDSSKLDTLSWLAGNRRVYTLADSLMKIKSTSGTTVVKTIKGRIGTAVTKSIY